MDRVPFPDVSGHRVHSVARQGFRCATLPACVRRAHLDAVEQQSQAKQGSLLAAAFGYVLRAYLLHEVDQVAFDFISLDSCMLVAKHAANAAAYIQEITRQMHLRTPIHHEAYALHYAPDTSLEHLLESESDNTTVKMYVHKHHDSKLDCALSLAASNSVHIEDSAQMMLKQIHAVLCGLLHNTDPHDALASVSLSSLTHPSPQTLEIDMGPGGVENERLEDQFVRRAHTFPMLPALACRKTLDSTEEVSYAQLNTRADAIAEHLWSLNVGYASLNDDQDEIVALCMPKTTDMYACILGVLKSGAAWCPIDEAWPEERQAALLQKSKADVVLVDGKGANAVKRCAPSYMKVVHLDEISREPSAKDSDSVRRSAFRASPDRLAYKIWTSGTTGLPKAVGIPHSAAVQGMRALCQAVPTTFAEPKLGAVRYLQFAAYVFDLSIFDIFYTWAHTGTVCFAPLHLLLDQLIPVATALEVTHTLFTPAVSAMVNRASIPSMRVLINGGEKLSQAVADEWSQDCVLVNIYGPAEATLSITMHTVPKDDQFKAHNIGWTFPTGLTVVVDRYGRVAPRGAIGELLLGGPQLARGYIGDADKTQEKFVEHAELGRVYHTGDLARCLWDGQLEYLGRNDDQVKINGVRIELLEINAAVKTADKRVRDADTVALPGPDDQPRIVSFVVAYADESNPPDSDADSPAFAIRQDAGARALSNALRSRVEQLLPSYMVPSHFLILPAFPRTSSAKIDRVAIRKAYDSMDLVEWEAKLNYDQDAPADQELKSLDELLNNRFAKAVCTELVQLCKIQPEQITPHVPFAALGVNSVRAMVLANRLAEFQLGAADFLRHNTLTKLAKAYSHADVDADNRQNKLNDMLAAFSARYASSESGSSTEVFPASGLQQSMLVETAIDPHRYWLHRVIPLQKPVAKDSLLSAIHSVSQAMQCLRLGFMSCARKNLDTNHAQSLPGSSQATSVYAPVYYAVAHRSPMINFREVHTEKSACDALDDIRQDVNPVDGLPPVYWTLLRAGDKSALVLSAHHAVYDAETLHRVLEMLDANLGSEAAIPLSTTSPYSSALNDLVPLDDDEALKSLSAWRSTLQDFPCAQRLAFPKLLDATPNDSQAIRCKQIVSQQSFDQIEAVASRLETSVRPVLQVAWARVLCAFLQTTDVLLGDAVSLRTAQPSYATIGGPLLATLPVPIRLGKSAKEVVQAVHQFHYDMIDYAHVPLSYVRELLQVPNHRPLFESLFVLEADWDSTAEGKVLDLRHTLDLGVNVEHKLALEVRIESKGKMNLLLNYDTQLISESYAEILLKFTDAVLAEYVNHPTDCPSLCIPKDEHILSVSKKSPMAAHAMPVTQAFQESVSATPNAIAVEMLGLHDKDPIHTLTYAELDRRSRAVAQAISQKSDRYAVIGVKMKRSLDTYVALLGILRSGRIYLPLDESLPDLRREQLLEDSRCALVIERDSFDGADGAKINTGDHHRVNTSAENGGVDFDANTGAETEFNSAKVSSMNIEDLIQLGASISYTLPSIEANDAAYLLYTSGSTGTPKGCLLSQENLACAIANFHQRFITADPQTFQDQTRFLARSAEAFDVHLLEALLPLSIGATIVTMPRARLLNDLGKAIAQASVSHACVVPSLFATKTGVVQPSDLPNLRLLVVGGEKISERIIQSWGDASVPVLNAYGPTETTIGISCADVQSSTLSSDIGSAFSGNQFVILANDAHSSENNSERRIAFRGEIGELCIVGNHVGLGYLNQVNPASFFTFQGKAAYATGDQARLMPNDHAEYLGREKQSQVKVRGARVELEEVNLAVLSQSDCAYAQTLLLSNSIQKEPHLVTFLSREARTTNPDLAYDSEVCNVENVVKKLRSTLSSYMVPSKLIPLNYLPLANVSGKVDIQALRHYYETACASSSIDAAVHYQGATTKEQQLITSLVMKLLQLEDPPSIDADLFGHGLDSIRAVRLAYALEEEKYSVPLVSILAEPTIAEIATNITHTHDEASDSARNCSEPRDGLIDEQNSGLISAQDAMQGKVYTGPQNDMQDADNGATRNVAQEAAGSASQDSMQDASKEAPQDASQNALQGAPQGAPQEVTQNALSTPTNLDSSKAHNSVYHSDSVNHHREPTFANAHTSSKEDFSKLGILPAELQSCGNLIAAAPCVPLQVATIARTLEVPSERLYINHIRIAKEPSVAKRWATCMTHHGIYRTRFIATHNTFVQAVTNLPVQVSVRSTQCTDAQCDAVADQIIARFMDQPPVQLVEYEDMICISMHHAVYDAASFALLQHEVSQSKPEPEIDLEKVANTYDVDYLAFAHRVATSEAHTTEYWTKKLSDMVYTPCPIMTGEDLPKAAAKSVQFTLRDSLNEIQSQAQHARISLHAYILTKFCSLFAQYVGEEEVTIGLVLSGRLGEANHAQLHGPCTTTVPFRFQDGAEALKATQKQLYEMLPYQFVRLASVARAINCTQLFDVLFSFLPDSTIQAEAQDTAVQDAMLTGYPLALEVRTDSTQDALQLELVYCPDHIPTQQAEKMLRQLAALVQGDESSQKVGGVDRSVVNAEPREPTPKDGFLALFAKHSAANPEKDAITFATSFDPAQFKSLSFRELNEESCKYAHRLIHKQGDGDVVYVHLTRRMELYIMMLAVWKAGKTYVPLDPTLPADRLVYMMETVGSGSLVTDSGLATNDAQGSDRLPFHVPNGVKVIFLQELSQDGSPMQNGNTMPNGASLQNGDTKSDGTSLPNGHSLSDPHKHCNICCSSSTSFQLPAYILFTSGSTGRPKGVQISHRALAAAIVSWREMLPFSKDSRMLQLASPGFDVSVFEVTFPLAMGFAIGSAPKDLLLSDLESAFRKLQITLADLPAALAGLLHPDRIPPLEWLMSGGDVIDQRVIQQWTTPPARLINAYGPTEGTIGNTLGFMNQSTRRNVVGYAYPTSTIYIMPRKFHSHSLPVYAGAIGELVVGGAQVADAYVNADQLTKEKFPLYNGQRVYRTGDRARLLYDQRLECLGRIERGQVKVNGQRVELEEIAHALSMEQEVKDACVLYLKHPTHLSKQLVAFLARNVRSAPAVGQDLRVDQDSAEVAASILQSVARKLAAYMVPTQVIMLEHALPLTPNNKVDVKRLSEQYESLDRSMLQALQPRSSTNQAKPKSLDRVCQALKQIGVHLHTDDGGDDGGNGDGNTSLEGKGNLNGNGNASYKSYADGNANGNANGDANDDSKRNAKTASNAVTNVNADASTSANTNANTSTNAITNSLANASFYALGIDSLSAIQVVRLLRSEQFTITAAELLQLGTPWRLAEHWDAIQSQKSSSNGSESNNVPTEEHSANGNTQLDRDMDTNQLATACLPQRDIFKQICESNPDAIVYPATPLQVGMLTQSVQTDGSLYIHTHTFRINAPTEIVAKVWRLLVKANTILRTSFRLVDDAKIPWVQVVHRDIQPEILETNHTPSRWTPDLITEKVLHTMQLETEENSTLATLRIHHALYDAHALDELMDDFDTLVRQATLQSIGPLIPVSRPAYARLVPYLLSGENHVDYWVQTLKKYRPRRLVPGTGSLQGCTASRILNLDIGTLQQQCRSANVSMHTLASLAFARLLALCTQTPDVCFGQVVSLRADVQDADRVIGPALNTIPVRINTSNASLQSVQKATDQGRSHRHAPLRAIQNALRTPTPLIDALLDVQRVDSSSHREYLELVPSDAHHSVQYALNVAMIQHTDHLELVATSKKQFADEAQLQDWLAKLEELFDQCAKQRESSFDTHLLKLNPTDADRLEFGNDQNPTSHRQVDHSQKVPEELLQTLCGLIADLAEVQQDEIHPETSLLTLGLDSIATIRLAARARLQGLNLYAEDLACPDALSIARSYMRSHASNDDDQYKSQAEDSDRDKSQSNTKQSKHHNAQTLATTQYSVSPISLQQAASLLECPVFELDNVLSVTSGQKMHLAQWVQSGYRNGVYSFVYTVPELNFPALQRAWRRLQERHAILRTIFAGVGQPVQPVQIQSKQTHALQHWQVRSMCFDELSRWVIQQQKQSVLSISQAMVQCGYVQGSDCNGLVLTLFHAMYDAWSLPLLVSDLEKLYNEEYLGGNRVMPEAMPQVTSQASPQRTSQKTSQETSQAMPQITSQETSQTTSQLASQERSQTTPQVTQKASPKATPESTSQSTISDLLIEYPIESLQQQFSKYAKALPCWLPDSSRDETFVQIKCDGSSLREQPSSPSFSGLVLACIAHTLAKSTQTQPVFGVYHHARLATIPGIEHLAVPCLNMLPLVPEVSSSLRQTATDIIHDMHTRRPYEQASLEAIHNACEISLTPRFNLMVNLLPSSDHSASCDSWRIKPHFALDSLADRQAGNLHSRLEEWTGMHCYATHPVSLDVAIEQDSLQFAMRSMLCESDAMSFLENLVNVLCDRA